MSKIHEAIKAVDEGECTIKQLLAVIELGTKYDVLIDGKKYSLRQISRILGVAHRYRSWRNVPPQPHPIVEDGFCEYGCCMQ